MSVMPPQVAADGPQVVSGRFPSSRPIPEAPEAPEPPETAREQVTLLARDLKDTLRTPPSFSPTSLDAVVADIVARPEEPPPPDLLVESKPEPEPEPEPDTQRESVNAQAADPEAPAIEAAQESAPDSEPPATAATDEISIPPMGDLMTERAAEHFFSTDSLPDVHDEHDEHEGWEPHEKAKRKAAPHVVARRAKFAKYVTWAVGLAAVVCVAAGARTALTKGTVASNAAKANAVQAVAAPPPAAEPIPNVAAEVPAQAAVAPAETVAAVEPAKEAPAEPTKTALEEKKDSRTFLERGKTAEAIEAGERAVALDATDGEAWLLLGAAYQEKGNLKDARRCYAACVKEGKRGPVGECSAMLR